MLELPAQENFLQECLCSFQAEVGGARNLILLYNHNFKRVLVKCINILTYIAIFNYILKQGLELEPSVQSPNLYEVSLEAALGLYFMYRSIQMGKQLPFAFRHLLCILQANSRGSAEVFQNLSTAVKLNRKLLTLQNLKLTNLSV